jgi:hypothetical protein
MGYAGMLAQLVAESSKESAASARQMAKFEKEAQARELDQQVSALMDKASDTRAEGIVSGSLTIAGGAVTVASVGFGPSMTDDTTVAKWNEAATKSAGTATGAGFANGAAVMSHYVKTVQATADGVKTLGSTITQAGPQLSHGIYGAKQIEDDAASTQAASNAKFHEAAKDEYDSIAKDARGVADKVNQFVQSVLAEKQMAMRAILKSA